MLFKISNLFSALFFPAIIIPNLNKFMENTLVISMNIFFFVVNYGIIRNYAYLDSRLYKMDNTVYVIAMIYVWSTFWMSRLKKPLLEQILSTMTANHEDEIFTTLALDILKPLLLKICTFCCAALGLALMFPIIAACFTNAELGDNSTLLWPTWFPWRVDTIQRYLWTAFLQLTSGFVLYSFTITQVAMVVCFIAIIKAYAECFRKMTEHFSGDLMENLNSQMARTWNILDDKALDEFNIRSEEYHQGYDDVVKQRYNQLIAYHQKWHRHIRDIVTCCNFFVSNSLFLFFDGSVLLSAMFLQKDGDLLYRLKIISGELLGCTLFAVFCYFGEIIINLNDVFRNELYNMKWYELSPQLRKTLIIFMQLTHVPLRIKAFQMYVIEFTFFAGIVRLCFSLLQLLFKAQH